MSRSTDVLYDAPGPRARRVSLIASVISIVVIAIGAWWLIYRPLKASGQLSWDRWGLLLDPNHPLFGGVWDQLLNGWMATFEAAFFAILLSLGFGVGLALLRAQLRGLRGRRYADKPPAVSAILRWATYGGTGVSRFWVEFFRGLPVVVTIFFAFKVLAEYGVNFENQMWFLVIGLTLYNSVVIGEILRSGMSGLPSGQGEAAASMGLSTGQTIRLVLFPQALRIMLPALISQIVVIFKDTSLGQIVAYNDALRTSRNIIEAAGPAGLPTPTIAMYFITGLMYILVCYGLSKLATYTQRRLARSSYAPIAAPAVLPIDPDAIDLGVENALEPKLTGDFRRP
jgi:glutamate transport system permease protein